MPDDNIIDLAPQFVAVTEPQVSFGCDHVIVQIVIAKIEDGRKVGEVPFNAIKLFHPFPVNAAIEQAIQTASDQRDQQ